MERELLISLVTRAQSGDSAAMESLFANFYNDVYYFALKTVKDSDIACDITQETFLEIIRTIGNLQEPAAFVTWMKQVTYHQCTRYFKKKKEVLVEEDEDGNTIFDTLADEREGSIPAEVYEQAEFRSTILSIINELSEEQRAAILLYYFDELPVGQIAQIQGVSEGTVKSRLNYARKSIKKSVESYEKKHDIKLHSFSMLPLLLLFFGKERMPQQKAAQVQAVVAKSASAAYSATAVALDGVAVAASAKGAVASAGTGLLAKLASISLIVKIIAGVVALAMVAGGAFALLGDSGHDCKDRDDDGVCDVCEKTMHSKQPNQTKPGMDSTTTGNSEPTKPESTGGAEMTGPQYASQTLFVYEVSYQFHGNIQNIHSFAEIYIETKDGDVYSLHSYQPVATIEGSNFFTFYDWYGYTDATGTLHLGRTWHAPMYTVEGITGQILYACIEGSPATGAYAAVYTLEDGVITCTQFNENGILYQGPLVLKTADDRIWDTFTRVECFCGNGWNAYDLLAPTRLYAETADGQLLVAQLSFASPDSDGSLLVYATLCKDPPNSDYQVLAFTNGMGYDTPLRYHSLQDTAVYCDSWYDTVSTFSLPEGYTVANIAQAYFGQKVVLVFDDGKIYISRDQYPFATTELVLEEELSALSQAGHILQIIDTKDRFIFLADDGFIYEKSF